jgi:DNA polymerase I
VIDLPYREIWLADFEFASRPGERQEPACLVAMELHSGRKIRLWRDHFGPQPPYPLDANSLFVAYAASAELCCHRVLNWPMPERALDLFTEFRDRTNGLRGLNGGFQKASLLDAMSYFGLAHIAPVEKAAMRKKFIAGNFDDWSAEEREAGLDYCETDVVALAALLPAMLPKIDLHRALIRGEYSGPAISGMQHEGVPIDMANLRFVLDNWDGIIDELIAQIDARYGVYEGRHFRLKLFEGYLRQHKIPWERTPSGRLKTDDDTFSEMRKAWPILGPLADLRHNLGAMRLRDLPIGSDGRNRCSLMPFASRTGRNQPSTAKFIFSPGKWLRFFIKPSVGYAIAYVDWVAAEFGIAAWLSQDANMIADYLTGDPHIELAKAAQAVPADATKGTHGETRDRYKSCNFGILYGMGVDALAGRVGDDCNDPEGFARDFMAAHKKRYRTYWEWSEKVEDHALLRGYLHTSLGWHIGTSKGFEPNPRSMRNFPIQGGCADLLRSAASLATKRGIPLCAPVHDAFLICSPVDRIDADVAALQACMAEVSRDILNGFELRSEAKIVKYPDRYYEKRGTVMWNAVNEILETKYAKKIS